MKVITPYPTLYLSWLKKVDKNRNNRNFRFKNKHPRKKTLLVKQKLTATMKEMFLLLQFTWPCIEKHASQ